MKRLVAVGVVMLLAGVAGAGEQAQLTEKFREMQAAAAEQYVAAETPAAARAVCEAYLAQVDIYEQMGLEGEEFDLSRSHVEARLAELCELEGDTERAQFYMERAIVHVGKKYVQPEDMIASARKIDEALQPKWRETTNAVAEEK